MEHRNMVWLIGSKGMLGSDVQDLLLKEKIEFIATDKEIDITDLSNLEKYTKNIKIDYIINCSAYTAVDKAEDEYDTALNINSIGVKNIANIAKQKNATLIHISTDYVFDGNKDGEYTEDDITNPISSYGKSKLAGEIELKKILQKYYIIRTSWLYGKNGNNFVYTMLRLFKERDTINVVNDQFGSPTLTNDLANFIINIINSNSIQYGIYNYSNIGKITWYQFAKKIYEIAQELKILEKNTEINPIETKDYPTKAIRPKNSLMSKSKVINNFKIDIPFWENSLKKFLKSIS